MIAHHGKGSLLRSLRAVAWSFVGVRKDSEFQQDIDRLSPLHLVAVGFAGVFVLVLGLMALVHWVV